MPRKYKIVSITQVFNEIEKDNLVRFFKYLKPVVDEIVIYDDCSTDGSYEYALENANHVIRGFKNDFSNEINHRDILIKKALSLNPDFILWIDADEILSNGSEKTLIDLCDKCIEEDYNGVQFHEINLWRSKTWKRTDSLFNDGWFTRLWKASPDLELKTDKKGLHQNLVPLQIDKVFKQKDSFFIHYGFSSIKNIAYKYFIYKGHGQRGYDSLDRFIDESKLQIEKVDQNIFPDGLYEDEKTLNPMSKLDFFKKISKYKEEVLRPKYSIICLIYKSTDWLDFIYNQVIKYTDLSNKEFFFIANEPTQEVIEYLHTSKIKHYTLKHSQIQKDQWYINNIYAAYNFGASKAKGDFLIFLNSDDALSNGWLDNLIKYYNGYNVLTSRLIESGKLRTGQHGIIKNCGYDLNEYDEDKFKKFEEHISEDKIVDGGLYMPMLISKKHFYSVNGFPEGNLIPDDDIYSQSYAKKDQVSIPGDRIFIERLKQKGITHQTPLNSNIYHFQNGEMDHENYDNRFSNKLNIAICNDICTGINNEKVIWDYLNNHFKNSYKVDFKTVGGEIGYSIKAKEFIDNNLENVEIIIQNASFIQRIDSTKYTIMFLQDDLRQMNISSPIQEKNIKSAQKLVTNSYQTALSYPEYDFDIIPIGVNKDLFYEYENKVLIREKYGYNKEDKIGIFVGSFSEVKGWSKIKACIKDYPEIKWILVSKYDEVFESANVKCFSKISQEKLADLYNCSDFFILGSKVETQCLAALEANFCNIPVIMPLVGIYKDFEKSDRDLLGVFDEDLSSSISVVLKSKFNPRKVMIKLEMDLDTSMMKWEELIQKAVLENKINGREIKKLERKEELKIHIREILYFIFGRQVYWNILNFFSIKNLKYQLKKILIRIGVFSFLKKIKNKL